MQTRPSRPWRRLMLCAALILATLPLLIRSASLLPRDTRALTARKYGGWTGVLRLWVDVEWAGSGPKRWLSRRVAEFERRHPGVYIQADNVSARALASFPADPHPPDMVLVSPGVLTGPEGLTELTAAEGLRAELLDRASVDGQPILLPVCLGGYALAAGEGARMPAGAGWDAALLSLRAKDTWTDAPERIVTDAAALAASGLEVVACADFTDQLAGLGIAARDEARASLCREFAAHLLSEDSQLDLASAGCFSPLTKLRLYDEAGPLGSMEEALASSRLCAPHLLDAGWRSACNEIVRKFVSGSGDPAVLWGQLRARLLQYPNIP